MRVIVPFVASLLVTSAGLRGEHVETRYLSIELPAGWRQGTSRSIVNEEVVGRGINGEPLHSSVPPPENVILEGPSDFGMLLLVVPIPSLIGAPLDRALVTSNRLVPATSRREVDAWAGLKGRGMDVFTEHRTGIFNAKRLFQFQLGDFIILAAIQGSDPDAAQAHTKFENNLKACAPVVQKIRPRK